MIVVLSGSSKCRESDDEDSDQGWAPRSDSEDSVPISSPSCTDAEHGEHGLNPAS